MRFLLFIFASSKIDYRVLIVCNVKHCDFICISYTFFLQSLTLSKLHLCQNRNVHWPFAKSISKNLINSFSLIVNFRDDAWLWVAICLSLWILATFGDITMICMQDRFSVLRCVRILALGGPYFLMFNWWLSLNWTHRKQLPIDILLIYAVLKLYWEIILFLYQLNYDNACLVPSKQPFPL